MTLRRWLTLLLHGLLAVAVAATIYVGHSRYHAVAQGELCDTSVDCRWNMFTPSVCLQRHWGYCTVRCAFDRDCPRSWRCDRANWQGPVCIKP